MARQVKDSLIDALMVLSTLAKVELTKEVAAFYLGALNDYDPEIVIAALVESAKKTSPRTGMPTVETIVKIITAGKNEMSRFDELVSLIGKHGRYRPPQVDILLGMTINRLGGWQKVCDWTDADLPFRRKDFEATYLDVAEAVRMGNITQFENHKLIGEHETAPIVPPGGPLENLLPAPPVSPPKEEKPPIDWFSIFAAHVDANGQTVVDIDSLPEHLVKQGFFKMRNHSPDLVFRYCFGQKPGSAWPYSFVDADKHVQAAKARANASQEKVDPNTFNSKNYEYTRFTD